MAGRIASAALWIAAAAALFAAAFFTDSALALTLALLVPALMAVCALAALFAARRIEARLTLPVTAEKGAPLTGTLTFGSRTRLFAGTAVAVLTAENLLTGEKETLRLSAAPLPRRNESAAFTLTSRHCGTFLVTAEKLRLRDWTGVFYIPIRCAVREKCTVLPETFPVELIGDPSPAPDDDSDRYSPFSPGNDPTEIFDLREYVPGDDLRRLHRKLSEKLDKPVVKTDSLPVRRRLLLFRAPAVAEGTPDEIDAVAECMASLAQALSQSGVPYALGWQSEDGCRRAQADGPDDLAPALMELLGAAEKRPDALTPAELTERERYGRMYWFSTKRTDHPTDMNIPLKIFWIAEGAPLSPETCAAALARTEL